MLAVTVEYIEVSRCRDAVAALAPHQGGQVRVDSMAGSVRYDPCGRAVSGRYEIVLEPGAISLDEDGVGIGPFLFVPAEILAPREAVNSEDRRVRRMLESNLSRADADAA